MNNNDILIYDDYVHNQGVLYRTLCRHYGAQHVRFVDANDILAGCLTPDIHLFVMPGGADLYYCEKLNGIGNQKIKSYVAAGGNYLGICAGAYYACREIEWLQGTPHQICDSRELNLVNCNAVGPITRFIPPDTIDVENMQTAAQIIWSGETFYGHYWGGPEFRDIPDKIEILAHYDGSEQTLPAVLKKTITKERSFSAAFILKDMQMISRKASIIYAA